jgi:hypothetical protein
LLFWSSPGGSYGRSRESYLGIEQGWSGSEDEEWLASLAIVTDSKRVQCESWESANDLVDQSKMVYQIGAFRP